MRPGRHCAVAALLLGAVLGQERLEVLGPSPATVKLGDAARVELRIDGRGADPRTPQLPEVPGLRLELSAPMRSSTTVIDNGRMAQTLSVVYQLTLRPQREGTFTVPPFAIWTGTREQRTPELRVDARRDLRGEELGWIEVRVPKRRVYVHEPIRFEVECGVHQGLRLVQDRYGQYLYNDLEVQAAWLSDFPGAERIELPQPTGDTKLIVANRQLFAAVHDGSRERQGQRWQSFAFDRAFLPTRVGTLELPAPMLRYHVLLREGVPDLFGRARGGQSDNLYTTGQPLTIEVLPIPEAGRPTPYYGAVGQFELAAALDRDTVKQGASVKLTLTITGAGNGLFLRVPSLDDLPGLHKLGQVETKRELGKVVVTYDLAPLAPEVREVPAIEWNYFDTTPGVEAFRSVHTKPLALTVLPLAANETLAPLPSAERKDVTPGKDDVFDLPDFAGPAHLARPVAYVEWWLAALLPWLLACGGALLWRRHRRRAGDVLGQRAARALRVAHAALRADQEPLAVLAGYLGDRLGVAPAAVIVPDLAARLLAAGLPLEFAQRAAAAVEQGTAARYGGGAPLSAEAVRELLQALEPQRFGVSPLWLFVLFCWVPALPAQAGPAPSADLPAAVAAYRAGDYRTAASGFRAAHAATGDRRCLRALGNCLYRTGDLPGALWAYESAALGMVRDGELQANLRLVRQQLGLASSAVGLGAELLWLREALLPRERWWLALLCMSAAAACLVLGWRRAWLRGLGLLFGAGAVVVLVDALWVTPAQPTRAIALQEVVLVAEPRAGLDPLATLRPGVAAEVLGSDSGSWLRVRAGERVGYAPRERFGLVQ